MYSFLKNKLHCLQYFSIGYFRGLIIDYYPDTVKILKAIAKTLGLEEDLIKKLEFKIKNDKNNLPIDVPDSFFKGPF